MPGCLPVRASQIENARWELMVVDSLLAPLERQLVMNLLWLESSIPSNMMATWVSKQGKKSVFCPTL